MFNYGNEGVLGGKILYNLWWKDCEDYIGIAKSALVGAFERTVAKVAKNKQR
jgi:hypothetical protein